MFSPHLFTHVYDIDTLIAAFCSDPEAGEWVLDTRDGRLVAPGTAEGEIDPKHRFGFTPLPRTYHTTLFGTHAFTRSSPEQQEKIRVFVAAYPTLSDVLPELNNSFEGGWVRERIKEAILDWMDPLELIPPSMRHANPQAMYGAPPPPPKKVRIS